MRQYELNQWLESELSAITDEYKIESRLIMMHVLKSTWVDLLMSKQDPVGQVAFDTITDIVNRRRLHEPIQYILGEQEFMGLPFKVSQAVLIPRQDTESLVEYCLDHIGGQDVKGLDIGTGSGAIAIALTKLSQGIAMVASDISEQALEVAKENALLNGVSDRVTFVQSDLFDTINGCFDFIVSNPPYIPFADKPHLQKEVTEYEPEQALFADADGLILYQKIIPLAKTYLKSGGFLCFEAGYDQAERILKLFETNGYKRCSTFSDARGIERFIIGYKE